MSTNASIIQDYDYSVIQSSHTYPTGKAQNRTLLAPKKVQFHAHPSHGWISCLNCLFITLLAP